MACAPEDTGERGYGGGRSRGDAWGERGWELNGGEAGQRPGGRSCAGDRAEAEGAEGVQRKKKEKRKPGTDLKILESSRVFQKTKNPH
jgi:hypothetical protein